MKTTTPILCALLAAVSTAGAQDSRALPATPGVPPVPPAPSAPGAPADIVVPTARVEQITEPLRWKYRASDVAWEMALRRPGPVTYLGVSATPPQPEFSSHLPIPTDTGLVVDYVEEGSPAASAGLQKSDVLAKLDDQILIHPRQLAVLVANRKEGESVTIAYVRKGKLEETRVVLGVQHAPQAHAGDTRFHDAALDVLLEGHPGRPLKTFIRKLHPSPEGGGTMIEIEEGERGAKLKGLVPPPGPKGEKDELREIRKMLEEINKRLDAQE